MKSKSEFNRVKRNGDTLLVKTLPNGSEVQNNGVDFTAYDADGNYLGFHADQDKAEASAISGKPSIATIDNANDLALWLMWNDAIDSGARVLSDEEGWQIISLRDGIFMRAKADEGGYAVELLTDQDMQDHYWDNDSQTFNLSIVKNDKLRLE
jgi:hypothetical protein